MLTNQEVTVMNAKEIAEKVEDYEKEFRNPRCPKFKPSEFYDLQEDWPGTWPFATEPGVYVCLDADENPLYVGKASMHNTVGVRLSNWFKYAADGKSCDPQGNWTSPPRYVMVVAVSKPFEAPSLEEYLICRLKPPDNTRGQ